MICKYDEEGEGLQVLRGPMSSTVPSRLPRTSVHFEVHSLCDFDSASQVKLKMNEEVKDLHFQLVVEEEMGGVKDAAKTAFDRCRELELRGEVPLLASPHLCRVRRFFVSFFFFVSLVTRPLPGHESVGSSDRDQASLAIENWISTPAPRRLSRQAPSNILFLMLEILATTNRRQSYTILVRTP